MSVDASSSEYAARVSSHWAVADAAIRSYWQSPVVMEEINRRITGRRDVTPLSWFVDRFCAAPHPRGLSLGSGDGQFEIAAVRSGACQEIVGIDISRERVARASARIPRDLRERVRFECRNLETYQPHATYDVVFANGVLHHIARLNALCRNFAELLSPSGLVYFDDFIGPVRFQWTDRQLAVINRLLAVLSDELRRDLVLDDGSTREAAARPDVEQFIQEDPSEAIHSADVPKALLRHLEPLAIRDYGGALFHQFFNRIMGNFAGQEALVRLVMEVDFLLTDEGLLEPNYLWGVYRPRRRR